MIRGLHAMFYSSKADELRAFFARQARASAAPTWATVGSSSICPKPTWACTRPMAAKPTSGTADISFYCDDIEANRAMISRPAVSSLPREVEDHGYGLVTYFEAPGDFVVQLYQPKYRK